MAAVDYASQIKYYQDRIGDMSPIGQATYQKTIDALKVAQGKVATPSTTGADAIRNVMYDKPIGPTVPSANNGYSNFLGTTNTNNTNTNINNGSDTFGANNGDGSTPNNYVADTGGTGNTGKVEGDTSGTGTVITNTSLLGKKPDAVVDNSAQFQQMYEQQLAAQQAKLKAAIAKARGNYEKNIAEAPAQFQSQKDTTEVNRYKNMQALREVMANQGQNVNAGVSRTETTNVNTAADGQLNALEIAQKKLISDANAEINSLETQGMFQDAELVATNAAEKLRAMIDEKNRVETQNYTQNQDYLKNIMTANQYDVQNKQNADEALLRKRTTDAELTGIDPETGKPTASEAWRNKEFDSNQAQIIWDNAFKQGSFDYQKMRDAVSDEQWGSEYQIKLDEYAWNKNPNNPTVRGQILQNQILELEKSSLPEKQKLELQKLKQDLVSGDVAINQAKAQIDNIKANTANTNKSTGLMGTESKYTGGSSTSTKDSTAKYNDYKSIFAKSNTKDDATGMSSWEKAARGIIFDLSPSALGNNYDEAINMAHKAYYDQVNNNWSDRDALKKELSDSNKMPKTNITYAEYYKKMLGDNYYNKLMKE